MVTGAIEGAITGAISGAITFPYCFVLGTPIRSKDGTKAIETIQPGDKVWVRDEETGDVALKEVEETYINSPVSRTFHVLIHSK